MSHERRQRRTPTRSSRRRFVTATGVAGIAATAGCVGGGEGDDDGRGGETPAEDAEPVTDTLTVRVSRLPDQFNLNEWAASSDFGGFEGWTTEIVQPTQAATGKRYFSGHTWEIDGREVSVPCLAASLEIDPPREATWKIDDRLTYWDGTPIDARAFELTHQLYYYHEGNHLRDDHELEWEALDDTTLHLTSSEERSKVDMERWIEPLHIAPWHPDFTEPWVEQYAETTTEDEQSEIAEELGGTALNVHDWASVPEENDALYIEGEDYSEDAQSEYVRENGELIHLCGNIHEIRSPEADRERIEEISRECARRYNYGMPSYVFHEYVDGFTGNVRDFDWAPRGHPANTILGTLFNMSYQVLGGIVQASYDTDYPEP